ncbi:MAG: LysR family transcriptional regulator [Rhodopseudomonas palustris]|uniref:LysR family transcriptional regulator n=1 Tax=Rhodopseudomonas palustris TaxID=1076 RepID=A0A933RTA1_RHOPL|nr:LysR family transcriptional regulator [Rhodopseudomonas palustris]
MDRFESMSILLQAVEAGSLSAAARKIGVPLATVSRKVSELEAHLKTRLFNRSAKKLSLTDAGRDYVVACKRILEDLDEAERVASGEYSAPRGSLVVTAPVVFGRMHLLPVMLAFLEAYPDIDIRLLQSDRVSNLLEEHVDLAVRIGELPDSSLVATRVGSTRKVVCGSPNYFAARGVPQTPDDLRTHQCITFETLGSPDAWTFTMGEADPSVAVRSRLVVSTADAAIDAAIAGTGVTRVLSYQIQDAVRDGRLMVVLKPFEPAAWPVSLVHTGQRLLPKKMRAFLDFAAPRLKAALSKHAI